MIERDPSSAGAVDPRPLDPHPSDSTSGGDGSSIDDSDVRALELDQLITDYFDAQREGRAPSVDDYVAAHPEHEHALRAVLPGASLLDRIGQRAEDASPQVRSGDRLGEFKLLGVLGRGGMGIVYEAVQESLDRPVALKVLPASRVLDRKSRERFMREAQAAASLQHPGIVAVHGVGEAEGQVYYAMQRVDGVPLDVLTAAARGDSASSESSALLDRASSLAARMRSSRLSGPERAPAATDLSGSESTASIGRPWMSNAAEVALQVAEALSYAHSRGVVHRDIKPSNVMLDDKGRAYVTDFGLCKVADTSSLTAAGDVVGTLRYVPPERFGGRDDARGDVYGLGLILYELLCGRPAFPQSDRAELVQAVTLHAPPRPRKINRDIPEDLERIVLASTAKLPEERYASAEDLIADLKAYLDGRPIRARAPGKVYLARLFLRRNRGPVAVAVTALALLALGSALYIRDLRRLVGDLEVARDSATRMATHAQLGSAAQAIEGEKQSLATRFLEAIPDGSRDWVWSTLAARIDSARLVVDAGAAPVIDASLDGAEERVAVLREGSVRIHSIATGELEAEISSVGGRHVAFAPTGDAIVIVEGDAGIPRVAPLGGPELSQSATSLAAVLRDDAIEDVQDVDSRPGFVALALGDGRVVVVGEDPAERIVHESAAGRGGVIALFGGDGRVAHAVGNKGPWVLGPREGRRREMIKPRGARVVVLAGARDARVVLALTAEFRMGRFIDDGDDGPLAPAGEIPVNSGSRRMVVSPDGERVVTATRLGRTRLWTIGLGPGGRVPTMSSQPSVVLWPEGGSELVVAGDGGEWRATPTPRHYQGFPGVSRVRGHFAHLEVLDYDASGDWFAVGETTGAWSIWNDERRMPSVAWTESLEPVTALALAADESGPIALAIGGPTLRVWAPGVDVLDVIDDDGSGVHGPWVHVSWLDPETAEALVAVDEDGTVVVGTQGWSGTWTIDEVAQVDGTVADAVAIPAGDGVVLANEAGVIVRVDGLARRRSGRAAVTEVASFDAAVVALSIGRSGRYLAVVTDDQQLHLVDLSTSSTLWSVQAGEPGATINALNAVAVDGEDDWVVTVGKDGSLRTWSLVDGSAGPDLLKLFNEATDVVFPSPGSPPVVLEFRGRTNHLEVDSIDRSTGTPGATPTDGEEAALAALSGAARIEFVERQLERDDLTVQEAWALWHIADGVWRYSRRYKTEMSPARAGRVNALAKERHAELESSASE